MKNMDFLKNNYIAHRGLHNISKNIPENSIKAFKEAIKKNYIIELDVHLTKDNKIVVFHDFNLKRVCNINKKIEKCTYDELLNYNLFNTKEKIPLLIDVLKLVDNRVPILIEIKQNRKSNLEKELSNILDNYKGLYAIQSFNFLSLLWFKKNKPNYIIGLLSSEYIYKKTSLKRLIAKTLLIDIILKSDFISYDIRNINNSYVQNKRKNKLVLSWTIRNKEFLKKGLKYSDNIIFENIDL